MSDLATELSAACSAAFEAEGFEARWGAVRRSDRPELADFQCNGCMGAAKKASLVPRDLAAKIAERITGQGAIERVDVAGPGFLNIRVSGEALSKQAEFIRADAKAGGGALEQTEKVVIDFGGPNVAKPMHVGHLRSAVIGDTLVRLFRFLGDDVTGDAHLGDWGLQMGHLITELFAEQPDLVYFDPDFKGPYPEEPPVTIEDLGRLYPQASAKAKEDPQRNEASQLAVAEMQAGHPGYRALLRHFINVSVEALKVDYSFLGVEFDLWKGESDVDELIPGMVEDLKEKGLAKLDDGAWIIDISRESDKKEMPPFMLINSRGGTGYHATDLATIVDRVETLHPDRILYVVDARQALHFEQVFRAADMAGLMAEDRMEHIGFGTVNGTDGKPFKTREGGVLRLSDLNRMALEEAEKKIGEAGLSGDIGDEERGTIAKLVARAALRFADLQNVRTTNYVFDLERFTSFEGKTGPYMLYAAVRIKSLLRRAKEAGHAPGAVSIERDTERALVLAMDGFSHALAQAHAKRQPHTLCEHVYSLAQAFSALYADAPIANADDEAVRASRLGLCEAVLKQLEAGLNILGIEAPERM
ncbi:arginine--tRNA ligase [Henriciella aquimarina]|uniref:arginine--tRNA ligase n=1 Tax=Henriciella aquimarina TaxID=545261 RepID=UPI000A036C41|nr:arginine--tRNA ligase [Henriciella aquimarina]